MNAVVRSLSTPWCYLYARNDVGRNADHDMRLHPFVLFNRASVLVIEPPSISRGGEARRVNGKIRFDLAQWTSGFFDHGLENRRQDRALHDIKDAVVVRSLVNVALLCVFPNIGHGATARRSAIDFHNGAEN